MDGSTDQLAEYKEKLCREAENLLSNILPGRVGELEVGVTNVYLFKSSLDFS